MSCLRVSASATYVAAGGARFSAGTDAKKFSIAAFAFLIEVCRSAVSSGSAHLASYNLPAWYESSSRISVYFFSVSFLVLSSSEHASKAADRLASLASSGSALSPAKATWLGLGLGLGSGLGLGLGLGLGRARARARAGIGLGLGQG